MTTEKAIKCSNTDRVGSVMEILNCFTRIRVTLLAGVMSVAPQKRDRRKEH